MSEREIDLEKMLLDDANYDSDLPGDEKEFEKDLRDLFELEGYSHSDEPLDFLENYY